MQLTGKQNRYLRGLGHQLKPVVFVGKEEINDAVIAATEEALETHELIKVKLQEGCMSDRKEIAAELSQATGAAVAQILGRTMLLYRPSKEQKINLPKS
ncbi:RNA-binding protein [Malonomonas rubra DSM 5091]|uniref:RNA-binding protein n=1 Tax=Malonomonas rubra DSM 5091 TaxID=1122189 RepID=A0A1M6NBJ8_MALRU|nr:ribosome assembly RNA-binding protein YhbY [Malonomonas rubra]SHJ93085.1 RNA-binding protein [Malonomonas rubra DSM 5091]